MEQPNHFDPLSITETVPRQTPRTDFGSLLADNLGSAFSKGAGLVSRALGSLPLVSAAVSGVQSVVGTATAKGPGPVLSGGSGSMRLASWSGGSYDSPAVQELLARVESGGELSSSEYLVLQRAVQQESQQYTAATNILKVRSDSAKAAINNMR